MTKRKHNEALETPLIKWPGGKSKEFQHFAELIPPFERYIEPFFGGGGVFFRLQPESAMINDVCLELVQFYRYVKGEPGAAEFGKLLRAYADTWAKAGEVATKMMPSLKEAYASKASADCPEPEIVSSVGVVFQKHKSSCALLSASPVCLDKDQFWKEVQEALVEKMIRTAKLEKIKGKLPAGDLEKNLETGIRGGIYMYYRGMMNSLRGSKASLMPLRIANYYFIREFCYGSMFRYNSAGDFNIPYGGIGYNDKDFSGKVERILSTEVRDLFSGVEIGNKDFEDFLRSAKLGPGDFMFLDPPYDTDFSAYENAEFGQGDQSRLASLLIGTKAKFMLVIKNTPFIYSLYADKPGIRMAAFDKKYLYNVRGRNDREVEHLIVFNYDPPQGQLL
jgi:DNA adenine methylase